MPEETPLSKLSEDIGAVMLHLVEEDGGIDIEGGRDGNIWERTAVRYIEVTGGKARREKIEQVLESELEPRYASQ